MTCVLFEAHTVIVEGHSVTTSSSSTVQERPPLVEWRIRAVFFGLRMISTWSARRLCSLSSALILTLPGSAVSQGHCP